MGRLEAHLLPRFDETVLEFEDALTSSQPGSQFGGVKRLRQVIIRPRFEAGDNVALLLLGGQQDHVHIRLGMPATHLAAYSRPVQAGHHPIQEGEARAVLRAECGGRPLTIPRRLDRISCLGQRGLDQSAGNKIIIRDQNPQRAPPGIIFRGQPIRDAIRFATD